ncbi:hypothetical protein Tco_1262792, partial [Tanacetum coccineum]
GELLNGELLDGELLDGELLDGELLNGELPNGELLKGTGSELVRLGIGLFIRSGGELLNQTAV